MIRVGPAGWSYPDSPGHVYSASVPSRFDALSFLAPYFDTIEINSTFYRPQPPKTYASWAKRVAANPDFRFTVKLWQLFTHGTTETRDDSRVASVPREAGSWTPDDVRMVMEGLEVLRGEGRLGALLAQFPWSFKPDTRSRERLMRLAETFAGWPLAVEVRHGRWGRPEELVFLRDLGVGFANLDQPVIGQSLAPTAHATGAVGYVRFHGRNYEHWFGEHENAAQRYDYLYTAAELAPWVERIKALGATDGVTDVYVITNNHYEGKGPANALMIRAMLEGRRIQAPPVLFRTYRSALEPYAEPSGDADGEGGGSLL
ncbi:MAG: DUF72 domain-containing protein [Gemmatimonadales bacterium]|jgi:uncharacterized protein YecE (DUF72 family)